MSDNQIRRIVFSLLKWPEPGSSRALFDAEKRRMELAVAAIERIIEARVAEAKRADQ